MDETWVLKIGKNMPQIFNKKYKKVVRRVLEMNLPLQDKIAIVIQELSEAEDNDNNLEYDYSTIAKAVTEVFIATYKGEEDDNIKFYAPQSS